MTLTTTDLAAIDAACRVLRSVAKERGAGCIELDVRADGRVEIRADYGLSTRWNVVRGDLHQGGAHPLPSAALAAALEKR